MDRRTFLGGAGCGIAALCSGCVTGTPLSPDVTESKTQTHDLEDGTALRVQNQHGSVTVEGYDGDDVEVRVEKSARTQEALNDASVTATESDGELLLKTEYDGSGDEGHATVSLTIDCPETVRVEEALTTHGPVEVTGVTGDATVESENGSLTVENVDGTVSLSTTNGPIDAHGIGGITDAGTSNGAIDVEVPTLADDAEIRTTNGAIDAALASDLDATVTVETTNGVVDVEGPGFSSVEDDEIHFSGTLGEGTHELELATTNGAVDVTALSD